MEFDFAELGATDRYKLMSAAITPRPIAWVTTQSAQGTRNAAPFSFFNMMGSDPPLVVIGAMRRPDGSRKDTAANAIETAEFVVNLVTEDDVKVMNFTCIDAPPGVDEITIGKIAVTPSSAVTPPRIASAPVSMECRLVHCYEAGSSSVLLGEVLRFHIDPRFIDADRLYVDTLGLNLVARMHGGGWYARSTDLFSMDRPAYATWLEGQAEAVEPGLISRPQRS